MKLITIATFRRSCFARGEAPDPRTVRRGIRVGSIPGRMVKNVGGRVSYWVDIEGWEAYTGNTLADRVLSDGTSKRSE